MALSKFDFNVIVFLFNRSKFFSDECQISASVGLSPLVAISSSISNEVAALHCKGVSSGSLVRSP